MAANDFDFDRNGNLKSKKIIRYFLSHLSHPYKEEGISGGGLDTLVSLTAVQSPLRFAMRAFVIGRPIPGASGLHSAFSVIRGFPATRSKNDSSSKSGKGRERAYPWITGQPNSRSLAISSPVSAPSPTRSNPSPLPT